MTLISEVIGDLVATARFIISIIWLPAMAGGLVYFVLMQFVTADGL